MMAWEQQERAERLAEFFHNNPKIWDDIAEEISGYLKNSEDKLKSMTCGSRDYWAGHCGGLEEVLRMKGYFQKWNLTKQST